MPMVTDKAQVWAFSEEFVLESPDVAKSRAIALELGIDPVTVGTGALLRAIAGMRQAKAAVEIGTGTGVSGLWILAGMAPDGVLTSIDVEAEFQQVAAESFRAAHIASHRTRLINGRALEVLPRLAASAYDMVVVDAAPEETAAYVRHAERILRTGGALVVPNALWFGNVADPARRDPHTVMMREVCRELEESESFDLALVPTGEGVAVAVRR